MKPTALTLDMAAEMMKNDGDLLNLRGTGITALPDNLTVGDLLDLRGTGITALPDNLTVGGWLNLEGTGIATEECGEVKSLREGDYVENRYLYADGILTHVKGRRKVGEYTFYIGRIKGRNVVSDGENYAHCDRLRDGIADLMYKTAKDRGAEQYRGMKLDEVMSVSDAAIMYRVITGACRQGTEAFMRGLGDRLKQEYTIRECIALTEGQYGHEAFKRFWEENHG